MRETKFVLVSLTAILLLVGFEAYSQEARARYQIMNLIRKEKLDLILPGAMRDNNVDMWIHAMRRGDPDAFDLDFGATAGWIIFTDRGGERIERALLGHDFAYLADESVSDVFGPESDLTGFVAERDPKTIAVNMSEWLTHADGLSHTQYLKLVKMLGDKYAARLVSSENVITDFRVRRVQKEIIAFANISEIQRQIMESAYRQIKPGVTTREDVGWWAQDRQMEKGLWTSLYGTSMPGVQHSEVSDRSETRKRDYILQPGDLLSWDTGLRWLNF